MLATKAPGDGRETDGRKRKSTRTRKGGKERKGREKRKSGKREKKDSGYMKREQEKSAKRMRGN